MHGTTPWFDVVYCQSSMVRCSLGAHRLAQRHTARELQRVYKSKEISRLALHNHPKKACCSVPRDAYTQLQCLLLHSTAPCPSKTAGGMHDAHEDPVCLGLLFRAMLFRAMLYNNAVHQHTTPIRWAHQWQSAAARSTAGRDARCVCPSPPIPAAVSSPATPNHTCWHFEEASGFPAGPWWGRSGADGCSGPSTHLPVPVVVVRGLLLLKGECFCVGIVCEGHVVFFMCSRNALRAEVANTAP